MPAGLVGGEWKDPFKSRKTLSSPLCSSVLNKNSQIKVKTFMWIGHKHSLELGKNKVDYDLMRIQLPHFLSFSELQVIPAIATRGGFTLRTSCQPLAGPHRGGQKCTLALTNMTSLEPLINLTYMSLSCGRKPEYPQSLQTMQRPQLGSQQEGDTDNQDTTNQPVQNKNLKIKFLSHMCSSKQRTK